MTSDSTSALQGRWEVLIVLKDLKEGMELSVLLVVGGGAVGAGDPTERAVS